jgi:hypothetical protein
VNADLFPLPYPAHDPGGKAKPRWPIGSTIDARFSECERYRYELSEVWDPALPLVMFALMNPSMARIEHADPTLIRTGGFARRWGYGGQLIANVHAYRVTDSKRLVEADDPVGPDNDAAILSMAARAAIVVLAYGQPPKPLRSRAAAVVAMLAASGAKLTYLRLAQDGTPVHPLYLPGSLVPMDYSLEK